MKANDIPAPVWYALLAVVAAGGVYYLTRKAAGAVGEAAYNAGNSIQDALVPGEDTLGTWTYGAVNTVRGWFGYGDPDPTAPVILKPKPAGYDYGQGGDSGTPYRPGTWSLPDPFNYDLGYILK